MKQLSSQRVAVTLLGPVLLIFALLFLSGSPPRAATGTSTKGTVEVGFTSTISLPNSGQLFQRILLNVVSVRVNPATAVTVAEDDPRWEVVPAPAGVGAFSSSGIVSTAISTGGNFGPNGGVVEVGQGRSEMVLDRRAVLVE